MISRWQWILKQTFKKLWFRATLFAIVAIITALLSILFKSMIPESVSVKVGAEAVDNILNILASSMLAVTTFSLSIMVTAYGSATTNVTPRATRLVVEDVTTQKGKSHFIHCHTRCHCPHPHHIASLDTAFDLSGEGR